MIAARRSAAKSLTSHTAKLVGRFAPLFQLVGGLERERRLLVRDLLDRSSLRSLPPPSVSLEEVCLTKVNAATPILLKVLRRGEPGHARDTSCRKALYGHRNCAGCRDRDGRWPDRSFCAGGGPCRRGLLHQGDRDRWSRRNRSRGGCDGSWRLSSGPHRRGTLRFGKREKVGKSTISATRKCGRLRISFETTV